MADIADEELMAAPSTRRDVLDLGSKIDVLIASMKKMESDLSAVAIELKATKEEVKAVAKKSETNESRIGLVEKEMVTLNKRIIDLVNRSKRRNALFKGFPNDIPPGRLMTVLLKWMKSLGVQVDVDDVERVHRSTYQYRDPNRPRDWIVAFTREKTREYVLKKLRSLPALKYKDSRILVFPDLAVETVKERNSLRPITRKLMEKKIKFFWSFPSTINVWSDGKRLTASNIEEGELLLKEVGVTKDPHQQDDDGEASEEEGGDDDSSAASGAAAKPRDLRPSTIQASLEVREKERGGKSKKKNY